MTFYHASDTPIKEWEHGHRINLTSRPMTDDFGSHVYSAQVELKRPAPDIHAYRLDLAQGTGKYDGIIVDSTDYHGKPIKLAMVNDVDELIGLKKE
jgi:hypothetical protein